MTDELLHPRQNPFVVGHDEAEATFLETYNSERMHHAWLLCGPRGIGKATLAYKMARFLLRHGKPNASDDAGGLFGEVLPSTKPTSLDIDPESALFHRVAASGHADLVSIERAYDEKKERYRNEIVIDNVRGVGGFLSMTPAEGGWRVVIIDAADEMNRNAANAVLKILEEPPRQAILILIAHNPGRLLPTIRSRCRRLVLRPLPDQTVADLVCRYLPETPSAEASQLAKLAEGSAGRAIALAQEGGLELYQELVGVLATLGRLDVPALHKLADKLARSGADEAFRTLGDLLRWWLGRMVVEGAKGKVEGLGLSPEEDRLMLRLLQTRGVDHWLEVWEKISQLFMLAQGGDLDRKQVILNVFSALEAAARG